MRGRRTAGLLDSKKLLLTLKGGPGDIKSSPILLGTYSETIQTFRETAETRPSTTSFYGSNVKCFGKGFTRRNREPQFKFLSSDILHGSLGDSVFL